MTIAGRRTPTIRAHRSYSRRALLPDVTQTNYRHQRNRCAECAHRLEMHNATRCLVENGANNDPNNDRPCRCDAK